MGISTTAVLIVGCLGKELDDDERSDWLDDGDLKYASYQYDASPEECIVGIIVVNDDEGPINIAELVVNVEVVKAEFLALTGKAGELYVCPNIT